jgi:hypothetical protein
VASPWDTPRSTTTKEKEPLMRLDTKKRKKATRGFKKVYEKEKSMTLLVYQVFEKRSIHHRLTLF